MSISRRGFLGAAALAACGTARAKTPPEKKLRICIIGDTKQGGFGHDLHLAWALRDDVEIVGLSDPDEAGRAKRAAECGALRGYADYRDMLEKERPDLVTVCPRATVYHKDYVLAAAAVGAHGFIEKPLTMDLAEADAMAAAVEAKRLKWAVAFNWHMVPEVRHALEQVRGGLIGQVMEMRARGKEDHRSGGEDMVVLGAHLFDLMRRFAGDPHWCQATALSNGRIAMREDIREATEPLGPIIGDSIQAAFGFDNGVTGNFASLRNKGENGHRWGIDVYGTAGVLSIRMEGTPFVPLIRVLRGPVWMPDAEKGTGWEALSGAPATTYTHPSADRYAPITSDLVAAIREDRAPAASLQDGRASLEMVSAVFASHISGRRVTLPLEERRHPLRA
jgi:predicted dehydrogenase